MELRQRTREIRVEDMFVYLLQYSVGEWGVIQKESDAMCPEFSIESPVHTADGLSNHSRILASSDMLLACNAAASTYPSPPVPLFPPTLFVPYIAKYHQTKPTHAPLLYDAPRQADR